MKVELSEFKKMHKTMKNAAENVLKGEVPKDDLDALAEYSPSLKNALKGFITWFRIKDPVEKRVLTYNGVYVTNRGKVFSINTDQELIPFWYQGDLRVKMPSKDVKRVGPLVASGFGIKSPDQTDNWALGFKNGDRRDLRPGNLVWITRDDENRNEQLLFIEDICRRILEHNGDIDAILADYTGSTPTVTRGFIKKVINKEEYKDVSDTFFMNENGKISKVHENVPSQEDVPDWFDTYQFLQQTKDITMAENLLRDKIKDNRKISEPEMIMMIMSVSDTDRKAHKAEWYVEEVKKQFEYDIPLEMMKRLLAPSGALTNVRMIYRGRKIK